MWSDHQGTIWGDQFTGVAIWGDQFTRVQFEAGFYLRLGCHSRKYDAQDPEHYTNCCSNQISHLSEPNNLWMTDIMPHRQHMKSSLFWKSESLFSLLMKNFLKLTLCTVNLLLRSYHCVESCCQCILIYEGHCSYTGCCMFRPNFHKTLYQDNSKTKSPK